MTRQAFCSLRTIFSLLILSHVFDLGQANIFTYDKNNLAQRGGHDEEQREIIWVPISKFRLQLYHPNLPKLPNSVVEVIRSVTKNTLDILLHDQGAEYLLWEKESSKDQGVRYDNIRLSVFRTKYKGRKLLSSQHTADSKVLDNPSIHGPQSEKTFQRRKATIFDHPFTNQSSASNKYGHIDYPSTIIVLEGNISFSFLQNDKPPNESLSKPTNVTLLQTKHLDKLIFQWLGGSDTIQNDFLSRLQNSIDTLERSTRGLEIQSVKVLSKDAPSSTPRTVPSITSTIFPTHFPAKNLLAKGALSAPPSAVPSVTPVSFPTDLVSSEPTSIPSVSPPASPSASPYQVDHLMAMHAKAVRAKEALSATLTAWPTSASVLQPSAMPTENLPKVNMLTGALQGKTYSNEGSNSRDEDSTSVPMPVAISFLTCACALFLCSVAAAIRQRRERFAIQGLSNETITDEATFLTRPTHDIGLATNYAGGHPNDPLFHYDLAGGNDSTWSDQWDSRVRVMPSHSSAEQQVVPPSNYAQGLGEINLSRSISTPIGGSSASSSFLSFFSPSHRSNDATMDVDYGEEVTIEFYRDEDNSIGNGSISLLSSGSNGSFISSLFSSTNDDPLSRLDLDSENILYYSSSEDSDDDMLNVL